MSIGSKGTSKPKNKVSVYDGKNVGSSGTQSSSSMIMTDPHWDNVVFLGGFNGTDGSTSFTNEKTAVAMNVNGTAQLDTDQYKFGGSSLLLDGNSDYATPGNGDGDDWTPGANSAYTWECWARPSAVDGSANTIMSHYEVTGNDRSWSLRTKTDNTMSFIWSLNGTDLVEIVSNAAVTVDTWEHWAVTRTAAGTINMWRGGVKQTDEATSVTGAFHNSSANPKIGLEDNGGGLFWQGWLDEVRITKNVARYTANFTPPTKAFPRSG